MPRRIPSLSLRHNQETGETILSGHGEMHLRVMRRAAGRQEPDPGRRPCPGGSVPRDDPQGTQQRGRHKKQSGGHGQFGDVVIEIKPLPRGTGFQFTDTHHRRRGAASSISRRSRPACATILKSGPLGFPVVDVAVNLSDGSYHAVDSSDMAFQMAAKLAMKEGMAACSPVLLEPVMKVEIVTPSDATAKITALIVRSGAARSSATTRDRAGRAGTWSRRLCRSRRSAT